MNAIQCQRCGVSCSVDSKRNPDAKMLRRSKEPKGFCVNCAVHNWLRNTYPVNMLLAQGGPGSLAYGHVQEQFTAIMKVGMADAMPDEIAWGLIIENWDLPFADKVKPRAENPCSQLELDKIATGEHPGLGSRKKGCATAIGDNLTITSFEQLNQLEPGLGDDLKKSLRAE